MPAYDYRCNTCRRKVTLRYKTYAEFDAAVPTCPRCGGTDLTRLISRVAIARSPMAKLLNSDSPDDSAFDDLDDADPRTLGRMLRTMSDEVGEEMGPEFDEVVGRLERGEDPEAIEASLPDFPDADAGGMPGAGGDLGGSDDLDL